ncbi:MAG TPA: hypothetical protein VII08_00345 [Myxococcales bacterium]
MHLIDLDREAVKAVIEAMAAIKKNPPMWERRSCTTQRTPTRPAVSLACVEECRFPRASRGDRLELRDAAEQICSRLGSSELSQIFPEHPQDLAITSPRRPKMFARNVRLQLKPNSTKQFTETLEKEVLPVLRKQEGFQDEVAFIVPGGTEAVEISFWQSKENAEAYSRAGYPEELKALGKVVEGTPQLQTYEVSNSTIHKIAARA